MTAADTTRHHIDLMTTAASGASFGPSAADCERRAFAARYVLAYLEGKSLMGAPVTAEQARDRAAFAWHNVPSDVAEALRAHTERRKPK